MFKLLGELFNFGGELLSSLFGLIGLIFGFAMDLVLILHTDMPRLEGLIIGVVLAWVLARRDKHPLLRALSAPLKMIIDILDLLWDQCIEMLKDVWEAGAGALKKTLGKSGGWIKKAWGVMMSGLSSLKGKLKKKSD